MKVRAGEDIVVEDVTAADLPAVLQHCRNAGLEPEASAVVLDTAEPSSAGPAPLLLSGDGCYLRGSEDFWKYASKYEPMSPGEDYELARAFVAAGADGIPASVIRERLGEHWGRGFSNAIRGFAVRAGIDPSDVIPSTRMDTVRRWRLEDRAIEKLTGKPPVIRPASDPTDSSPVAVTFDPVLRRRMTNREAIVKVLSNGQALGTSDIFRAVKDVRTEAVYMSVAHEIMRMSKSKLLFVQRERGPRGALYALTPATVFTEGGEPLPTVN
jgi:hypothetical protein